MSEISGGSAENDEMNTPETGGETGQTGSGGTEGLAGGNLESVQLGEGSEVPPAAPAGSARSAFTLVRMESSLGSIFSTTGIISAALPIIPEFTENTIASILQENGAYFSPKDAARVSQGADSIRVVQDLGEGVTGGYRYSEGKSSIQLLATSKNQLERSAIHETVHCSSFNREIIVPEPSKGGYMVYNTVGTRQASWFKSDKNGEISNYAEKGRGMNEGITTMYTNRELAKISQERALAAQRQQIYGHATDLCTALEGQVGEAPMKEAFFSGNMKALEDKVNELAGDKVFDSLRSCLDRAISDDYTERVAATREAQEILARMAERSKK